MADIIKNGGSHEVFMSDRKTLRLTGVSEVISFDDLSVVLKTACGELAIDGEGLRISTLDTAHGTLDVSGNIHALNYFDKKKENKKGVLGKIFG